MEETIRQIREGLDEMCANIGVTDAEWCKINAIRFVENYRIMRALEKTLEDSNGNHASKS